MPSVSGRYNNDRLRKTFDVFLKASDVHVYVLFSMFFIYSDLARRQPNLIRYQLHVPKGGNVTVLLLCFFK